MRKFDYSVSSSYTHLLLRFGYLCFCSPCICVVWIFVRRTEIFFSHLQTHSVWLILNDFRIGRTIHKQADLYYKIEWSEVRLFFISAALKQVFRFGPTLRHGSLLSILMDGLLSHWVSITITGTLGDLWLVGLDLDEIVNYFEYDVLSLYFFLNIFSPKILAFNWILIWVILDL